MTRNEIMRLLEQTFHQMYSMANITTRGSNDGLNQARVDILKESVKMTKLLVEQEQR